MSAADVLRATHSVGAFGGFADTFEVRPCSVSPGSRRVASRNSRRACGETPLLDQRPFHWYPHLKMGGSRKKSFIDKKNAVTYALMAKPDAGSEGAAPNEEPAQDPTARQQMWMRKDNNRHVRDALADAGGVDDGSVFDDSATETMSSYSGMSGYSALSSMSNVTWIMTPNGPMPRRERLTKEKRKELRELGFDPNDGYDYTRHLRKVGEGGGTVFVPTRKDHVKGILGLEDGEQLGGPSGGGTGHKTVTAGGSGKRGTDSEQVFLREDVEKLGDKAKAITDNARAGETEHDDGQRWTHERVKAITDERIYVAKLDNTLRNAVIAKQTSAPKQGVAAIELKDMIEKMEEFEQAEDSFLPKYVLYSTKSHDVAYTRLTLIFTITACHTSSATAGLGICKTTSFCRP